MALEPKINQTCSNTYLIDERMCLGNSLDYINFNVASLAQNLDYLEFVGKKWNNIFSIFATNSSDWIDSTNNVLQFASNWTSAYNTVNSLSSTWSKEFTVYYPRMIEINTWYSYSTINKTDLLTPWLNFNFPLKNYSDNQLMSIYIQLYTVYNFQFTFNRSYQETCTPNGGGGSVSCYGCGAVGVGNQGCNWNGRCFNAYQYCSQTPTFATIPLTCSGSGKRTLKIGKTVNGQDQHVARIIRIAMRKTPTAWVLLSET